MVLVADPSTAYLDPFRARRTLVLHCAVADPVTGERYCRDPRNIARKAEEHLFATGLADTAYFGPEPEFFIFDDVRFATAGNGAFYEVDSIEGQWNTGRVEPGGNLGYKPRTKEGYFPAPPMDHYQDLRSEMAATLQQVGIPVELHHHEVASRRPGRDRHPLRHAPADGRQAHDVQVRPQERGVGERQEPHVHAEADLRRQRLGHAHPPVAVEGRRAAVLRRGGLRRAVRPRPLVHRRPAAPRARRCWRSPTRPPTPTSGWCRATRRRSTSSTRSATGRRPAASPSASGHRGPSGSSSAAPTRRATRTSRSRRCSSPASTASRTASSRPTRSTRTSTTSRPRSSPACPRCRVRSRRCSRALEADNDFLQAGGVFTEDLLETWISYKREHEVDALRLRPHPYEFTLYYDI